MSKSAKATAVPFPELLRMHREAAGLTLQEVAAKLKTDFSLVSKWERGARKPVRADVAGLARVLKAPAEELLTAWLRDAVVYAVGDDEFALDALKAAEAQVAYQPLNKATMKRIIVQLKELLKHHPLVKAAWLFGSFARGEARLGSDIDLMVEFEPGKVVSLFDHLGIAHDLGEALGRKVDLVEKGMLKDFAARTAEKDFIRIHG